MVRQKIGRDAFWSWGGTVLSLASDVVFVAKAGKAIKAGAKATTAIISNINPFSIPNEPMDTISATNNINTTRSNVKNDDNIIKEVASYLPIAGTLISAYDNIEDTLDYSPRVEFGY